MPIKIGKCYRVKQPETRRPDNRGFTLEEGEVTGIEKGIQKAHCKFKDKSLKVQGFVYHKNALHLFSVTYDDDPIEHDDIEHHMDIEGEDTVRGQLVEGLNGPAIEMYSVSGVDAIIAKKHRTDNSLVLGAIRKLHDNRVFKSNDRVCFDKFIGFDEPIEECKSVMLWLREEE
jgi:hypothetical protein